FHVGHFCDRYTRVHERLRKHFEEHSSRYAIDGKRFVWVQLEATPERWLTSAIATNITRACLVIADVTPLETTSGLLWNPNVMHELGRADQLQVPTFRI